MAHMNARSLNVAEKLDEMLALSLSHNFDIFAVSETWLKANVQYDSISIPGYNAPLRKDRVLGRGGGVALYIANHLPFTRRSEFESQNLELLWTEIVIHQFKIICGVCYRPPNSSSSQVDEFFDSLQNSLDQINIKNYAAIILLGDFNAHYNFVQTTSRNTDVGIKLYHFLECNNLFQVIDEPTRITTTRESILDLIISDSPGLFTNSGTISPPANCDHNVIFATLTFPVRKQSSYRRQIWNFNGVNEDALTNALMNADWDSIILSSGVISNIDAIYEQWFSLFYRIVSLHIPYKNVIIRPRDKMWMNGAIRCAMRKRDRLLKTFSRSKSAANWEKYRRQRNFVVNQIRLAKIDHDKKINNILSDSNISSKKWWRITKSLYGNKLCSSIPALKVNNDLICDSKKKADVFNEYFVAQTFLPTSNSTDTPVLDCLFPNHTLPSITVSTNEVLNILNNLNVAKACGHDGIGNKILRMCGPGICSSLTTLINLSLFSGQYPHSWKMANVLPLFKKDDRQDKSNYRPVSLLPCVSKICEKIVFTRLYNFLNEVGFFYHLQSGFRPGDSTVMQLIYIVQKIVDALERGNEVRAVFLDISKAFDKVWHKGLLAKLKQLGISGSLYKWFESYLSGRFQRVVLDGQNSEWCELHEGVPQGSVLGPLLFLIYINDITIGISSDCLLFADDSFLLEEVLVSPEFSAHRLNSDLQVISNWSDRWLVTLNASKTKTMTFSSKHIKPVHPVLHLAHRLIDEVCCHDHLGVTLLGDLSWRSHILKVHQKASKKLNMIKGLKFRLNRYTLEILYKSLVRSTMEYADVVWDGCSIGEKDLLESVQYEAARLVTGAMKGTHRESLLDDTSWQRLENRRSVHKLVMMYKIVNNLVPSYLQSLCPKHVSERTSYCLRSSDNLSLPQPRTERFKKSFIYSTILLWNNLSDNVRCSLSLVSFKNQLLINSFSLTRRNYLFYVGDRYPSALHARLRLGNSALNAHLFLKGCIPSPFCICGAKETVEHFLLFCPRFAALRDTLLTFAAQKFRDKWFNMTKAQKIHCFLYGSPDIDFQSNVCLFKAVQSYIVESTRFTSY